MPNKITAIPPVIENILIIKIDETMNIPIKNILRIKCNRFFIIV